MDKNNQVSDQNAEISDSSANNQENLTTADKDYRADMFKFKNKFKDSEDEKIELERKLKEYERAESVKQGNYQEVIDNLKTENANLLKNAKEKDLREATTKIETSIELYAKDKGCKDVKAFIKLLGDGYKDTVSIDKENLTPLIDDVKLVVESGMKKYEHLGLFGKSINITDRTPNNNPLNMPVKRTADMTSAELQAHIRKNFK